MNTVKFTKFEKIAGLFICVAIVGTLVSFLGVAIQRGWLESKRYLEAELSEAEGLRRGTSVQMAGLKVGAVIDVELKSKDSIVVKFQVQESYFKRIREDSMVRVVRPFIVGEKVLDISVGSEDAPAVAEGTVLPSEPSFDVIDLLNGRRVGAWVESLSSATENLRFIMEAFSDRQRTTDFVEMYDQLKPLLFNMNRMAQETHWLMLHMNKQDRMVKLVDGLRQTTDEINSFVPEFKETSPNMLKNLNTLTENMSHLTTELSGFLPILQEFGPEMPRVGRRAIEALDEAVVTLKAMQKSFLLRGATHAVRESEAQQEVEKERQKVTQTKAKDGEPKGGEGVVELPSGADRPDDERTPAQE